MKYVALLRGINVGGSNLVKMAALKDCLERQGFEHVATYIQSGNVVFDAKERSAAELTTRIEGALSSAFGFEIPIVLRSAAQLKTVIDGAPPNWTRRTDLRRNVAFLRPSISATQALRDVETRDGVDEVVAGKGVLYMTTPISELKSSRFNKLVAKKVYREMTIRNFNTCQKILGLLDR